MDKRKLIPVAVVIILVLIWRYQQNSRAGSFIHLSGRTMGPIEYNIKYLDDHDRNFKKAIDSLLASFNQSMSTYIEDSEISRFNRSDKHRFQSPYFYPILQLSASVYEATSGAFDPTVGPLVKAYGFGPEKNVSINDQRLDSLRQLVGFSKLRFDKENASKDAGVALDFSAIAKGYAVDLVSEFLSARGIEEFMVEIGGEVRTSGYNPDRKAWRIGIEDPTVTPEESRVYAVAVLKDRSMATSGNYRNFIEEDGKRYVHTVSPFTGEPVIHSLLSATVFSNNCAEADAYATAFMVLGFEKSQEIVNGNDSLEAFFIYSGEDGSLSSYVTPGIEDLIRLEF